MTDRVFDWLQEQYKDKKPDPPRKIFKTRNPTLHRRDVDHVDFYVLARFIHALTKVGVRVNVVDGAKSFVSWMPLVGDLGVQDLRLPVWQKTGELWQHQGYQHFKKEAVCVAKPMMRAIANYLGMCESAIVTALFRLSFLSVDIPTEDTGNRRVRQKFTGRLINPVDSRPLSLQPEKIPALATMEGFILDKQRVVEWVEKDLAKRGQQTD